ncbi:MAG: DUF3306 domain-containing protein [Marinibacterium sp.]
MSDLWTRRKAAVAAEERAEQAALDAAARSEIAAAQADRTDAELLAEHNLPDPETLGEGDDFRAFLDNAIPDRLKTRALRRLWRVNPVLANLDGLVDYGEDFTDAATVMDSLTTAYRVGKGMLAQLDQGPEESGESDAGDPEDVAADIPDLTEAAPQGADEGPARDRTEVALAAPPDAADIPTMTVPRRPRLTFDTQREETA